MPQAKILPLCHPKRGPSSSVFRMTAVEHVATGVFPMLCIGQMEPFQRFHDATPAHPGCVANACFPRADSVRCVAKMRSENAAFPDS